MCRDKKTRGKGDAAATGSAGGSGTGRVSVRERERERSAIPSRRDLANVRVIQRNLVYIIGLAPSVAREDVSAQCRVVL